MTEEMLKEEMRFLLLLKEVSTQCLLEASLKPNNFPKGFDIIKAISVLNRTIDADIEYLLEEPDDYLEIYG